MEVRYVRFYDSKTVMWVLCQILFRVILFILYFRAFVLKARFCIARDWKKKLQSATLMQESWSIKIVSTQGSLTPTPNCDFAWLLLIQENFALDLW